MKRGKRVTNRWTRGLVAIGLVAMTVASARADVIYADDFSGATNATLNGTTPDVTPGGETWVAHTTYKADGSFGPQDAASMSLAFVPENGEVYTLDVQIENIGGGAWVQFGFGNSTNTGLWAFNLPAWCLLRQDNLTGTPYVSTSGKTGWDLGSSYATKDLDYRIVLDTTLGTGNWKASMYAKEADGGDYTEVLSATALTDEGITSVGFCTYNSGGNFGKFSNFSLSTPPPSGMLIIIK